jgi:hypothetical protein
MSKRIEVTLSDDVHELMTASADAAGIPLSAWTTAALEREAFRQLCLTYDQQLAEHPELVGDPMTEYRSRQVLRTEVAPHGSASSAA